MDKLLWAFQVLHKKRSKQKFCQQFLEVDTSGKVQESGGQIIPMTSTSFTHCGEVVTTMDNYSDYETI